MRLFLPLLAALLAGALAGCDFTPTLDVPLPDFQPALAVNGVLAADSTVELRVTEAVDPYGRPDGYRRRGRFDVPDGLTAELIRDGVPIGPLRLDVRACPTNIVINGVPETYPCGVLASDVVVEAGRTYTVRASAPGFPPVEATVTVPERAVASASGSGRPSGGGAEWGADIEVTLRDRAGPGDLYGLLAVTGPYSYEQREPFACVDPACTTTRDTVYTVYRDRVPSRYTTTDPLLLASARTVPTAGIEFVAFTDETFDGTERAFEIRAQPYGRDAEIAAVWVIAIDERTWGAYQIAWVGELSGDGTNPLSEPVNLPSNVTGGYGMLGAVTITEALLE